MLSILAWGGIGDTLRNLALVPHEWLFRRLGLRSQVFHMPWNPATIKPCAPLPSEDFFKELIERCPSLEWRGTNHRGAGRWSNRALRETLKIFNGNRPPYFPFTIPLTASEEAALPPGPWTLGIQTHLSGMPTKRWGIGNWRALIAKILDAHPGWRLLLIDNDPAVQSLDPRAQTTAGLNLAQSISLVSRCERLLSVDSWVKYIAAAHGIPQMVIVPDQRSDYPRLDAATLARAEFAGIWNNPRNRLIGLEGKPPQLTLPRFADLLPEMLFDKLERWIS